MSAISDKYNQLKARGLDLGPPLANEEPAPSGGRVRRYRNGNIYWCSATGAHEVHGGILSLYLAHGGPGANPHTGGRDLGYPASDEEPLSGNAMPHSRFEWGAIYWIPGTGGCVLYGSLYSQYQRESTVGMPITGNVAVAGGQAAYFERGIMFSAGGAPGVDRVLIGKMSGPPTGCPVVVNPTSTPERRFGFVEWRDMKRQYYTALTAWRPSVFTDLLQGRLALAPVGSPLSLISMIPSQVSEFGSTQFIVNIRAILDVPAGTPLDLKDRTLYDLCFKLPNGNPYTLSHHCIYTKSNWDQFGLLHITDLHISGRNDGFRSRLQSLGLADAGKEYSNFQDNLRDFIRYANKLHAQGLADVVLATGDLIDYVAEEPEGARMDNFVRLRQILLGHPHTPGSSVGTELRVPIFVTRGNHDYRLHPYELRADVDLPGDNDKGLNEHSAHNLTESEAVALQGGRTPQFGAGNAEQGVRAIRIDEFDNKYYNFKSLFTPKSSYVVRLGKHRLVVLDTKYDNGLPPQVDLLFLTQLAAGKHIGVLENRDFFPATQKLLNGRGPDSVGCTPDELNMFRNAVVEAGTDGLVIVGLHCPPFHINGGEYPYYQRETLHPTANPALTEAFVAAAKIPGTTWPRTGTPHFKDGDLLDGMDDGFLPHGGQSFIDSCAGVNLPRPVDLVLYGHHHERVEHRVRFNEASSKIEYLNDFYTENPERYYSTTSLIAQPDLPIGSKIEILVVAGASLAAVPTLVRRHSGPGVPVRHSARLDTPPYPEPLSAAANPRDWWNRHRPIFAQTAALGPIDERQRFGTFYKVEPPVQKYRTSFEGEPPPGMFPRGVSLEPTPGPHRDVSFQGFRLVQVKDGAIERMRYITLSELRRNNFTMPWETGRRPFDHFGDIHPTPTPTPPREPPSRPPRTGIPPPVVERPIVRDHRRPG